MRGSPLDVINYYKLTGELFPLASIKPFMLMEVKMEMNQMRFKRLLNEQMEYLTIKYSMK